MSSAAPGRHGERPSGSSSTSGHPRRGRRTYSTCCSRTPRHWPRAGVLYPYDEVERLLPLRPRLLRHGVVRPSGRSVPREPGTGWRAGRAQWDGPTVIVSSELLAAASPDRIERGWHVRPGRAARRLLGPRSGPSAGLRLAGADQAQTHGDARAVRRRPCRAGAGRAGAVRAAVLGHARRRRRARRPGRRSCPWSASTCITMPPPGGPPDALWTRFCAVTGLDPLGYDTARSGPTARWALLRPSWYGG